MNNIKVLEDLVKNELQDLKTAHDFSHIQRVVKTAQTLAEAENADKEIVTAMALLHDLVRPEGNDDIKHTELTIEKAKKLLNEAQFDEKTTAAVIEGIKTHSLVSKGGKIEEMDEPKTLEAKILFDADKIDALGPIGIARWFASTSHKNWTIEQAALFYLKTIEDFKEKKEGMYTKIGSKIAYEKYTYSKQFMEKLLEDIGTKNEARPKTAIL